jgi:hypothetical protein
MREKRANTVPKTKIAQIPRLNQKEHETLPKNHRYLCEFAG